MKGAGRHMRRKKGVGNRWKKGKLHQNVVQACTGIKEQQKVIGWKVGEYIKTVNRKMLL